MSLTSFWYYLFVVYSGIVDFEQINAYWVVIAGSKN